jgi:hypothetical protein
MTIPVYNATDIWNDSSTVFTAIKMNVTNTASAAGSKLIDLQVGGTTHFSVIPTSSTGANLRIGNNHGFADAGGNAVQITVGGANAWQFDSSGNLFAAISGGKIALVPTTILGADAAGIFAQQNGVNPQSFRVYNTFTNSSNYERGIIDWTTTSNVLTIGAEALGSGTLRAVKLIGSDITVQGNTATPAGGSTSARLLFGTTAGFGIYYGSGAPTVSAAAGSLYIRTDNAGANLRLYSNTTGSTTWAAITSA